MLSSESAQQSSGHAVFFICPLYSMCRAELRAPAEQDRRTFSVESAQVIYFSHLLERDYHVYTIGTLHW